MSNAGPDITVAGIKSLSDEIRVIYDLLNFDEIEALSNSNKHFNAQASVIFSHWCNTYLKCLRAKKVQLVEKDGDSSLQIVSNTMSNLCREINSLLASEKETLENPILCEHLAPESQDLLRQMLENNVELRFCSKMIELDEILNIANHYITMKYLRTRDIEKTNKICLGGRNLTRIPSYTIEYLFNFKNLKELDFDNNKIEILPSRIFKLVNLTRLELQDNLIKSIPPEIGCLKELKTLRLCCNKLTSLPKQIGEMKSLIWIFAGSNQIPTLPEEICSLKNLRNFSLYDNKKLTFLPHKVVELWFQGSLPIDLDGTPLKHFKKMKKQKDDVKQIIASMEQLNLGKASEEAEEKDEFFSPAAEAYTPQRLAQKSAQPHDAKNIQSGPANLNWCKIL